MGGQNPAIAMDIGKSGILDLTRRSLPAQLMHGFDNMEHPTGRAGMGV